MTGFFEVGKGGAPRVELDEVERSILRSLAVQLMELIGPGSRPAEEDGAAPSDDPFERLMQEMQDTPDGPVERPTDPALARLFPDAYGEPGRAEDVDSDSETAARAAEFRKYTEPDLRQRKRDDALALIRTLDGARTKRNGHAIVELDEDDSRRWLGTLNDLRLTLGSRLDVSEDDDRAYRMPDTDPDKPLMMAYLWLGGLQETLVGAMMG
ncbi:hypothetical protein BIV57_11085 [Mangrovactinospora gilvigrisea]|uniref:DUF2017 domain-containing protein n=1 Tax=Mangrovactinospora gilvigrisea TaxID=1428644 RepID=A0A1J7BFI8_9ACTN|nr:DUF2017 domain-containing protein [Mangrovactinospora gilvigrisea]OIV37414.1 hypothetical protein BIV57_11085 [Mangrovactinospora gilvigrisea]